MFLEIFGLRIASKKGHTIGETLIKRLKRASSHVQAAYRILDETIYGKPAFDPPIGRSREGTSGGMVAGNADNPTNVDVGGDSSAGVSVQGSDEGAGMSTGSGRDEDHGPPGTPNNPIIDQALLRQELANRIAYFSTVIPLATATTYVTVYDAFLKENDLQVHLDTLDARIENSPPVRRLLDERVKTYEDLTKAKSNTDALLVKFKQTREEWNVGGERWTRAAQARNPEQKMYEKLLKQYQAEDAYMNSQTVPNRQAWESLLEVNRKALEDAGYSIAEWTRDGRRYKQFQLKSIVEALERIYRRILLNAAGRSMQMRELKARSSGHKNSAQVVKDIQRHYPKIEADIKLFNTTAASIDDPTIRPPSLSFAAFVAAQEDADDVDGDRSRDSLFTLHLLRTRVQDDVLDSGNNSVVNALWATSRRIRTGIRELSKWDRGLEELKMSAREWERFMVYTEKTLGTMLSHLRDPSSGCKRAVASMLWDRLQSAETLLRSWDSLGLYYRYIQSDLRMDEDEFRSLVASCRDTAYTILRCGYGPDIADNTNTTQDPQSTNTTSPVNPAPPDINASLATTGTRQATDASTLPTNPINSASELPTAGAPHVNNVRGRLGAAVGDNLDLPAQAVPSATVHEVCAFEEDLEGSESDYSVEGDQELFEDLANAEFSDQHAFESQTDIGAELANDLDTFHFDRHEVKEQIEISDHILPSM